MKKETRSISVAGLIGSEKIETKHILKTLKCNISVAGLIGSEKIGTQHAVLF